MNSDQSHTFIFEKYEQKAKFYYSDFLSGKDLDNNEQSIKHNPSGVSYRSINKKIFSKAYEHGIILNIKMMLSKQ